MATPNEITTIIAARVKRELDISYRLMLYEQIKVWRSRLIANTLDRNPQEKIHFMQDLVIPMESANDKESVSTVKVPKAIEHGPTLYDYVGPADGSQAFTQSKAGATRYLKAGCYSSLIPSYDKIDCRIWVDRPGLCNLLIRGVFDNPDEAFECCSQDPWNSPFPVSNKILQQIIQYVSDEQIQNQQANTETADVAVPTEERSIQRS